MGIGIRAISKTVYEPAKGLILRQMEESGKVFGDKMNLSVQIS
jgi:hypothetical protein